MLKDYCFCSFSQLTNLISKIEKKTNNVFFDGLSKCFAIETTKNTIKVDVEYDYDCHFISIDIDCWDNKSNKIIYTISWEEGKSVKITGPVHSLAQDLWKM